MEGFGIILQTIGALLIAYSQFQMNRTIGLWLQSLDLTVGGLANNDHDIVRVSGIDKHLDRDLKRDKWMHKANLPLRSYSKCNVENWHDRKLTMLAQGKRLAPLPEMSSFAVLHAII